MSARRGSRSVVWAAMAVVVLLLASGCGNDTASSGTGAPPTDPPAQPEVFEVGEALALPDGAAITVVGSLVGEHGATDTYLICVALAESFPPQCGGDHMFITDVDALLAQLDRDSQNLITEGTVSWSESPVTLVGTRRGPDGFQPATLPPSTTLPAGGDQEIPVVEPGDFDVEPAVVVPDALELHTVAPHRAVLVDDSTLELHVWGGVAPCWALQSVSFTETDTAVTVDMIAGVPPEGVDAVCILIAIEFSHTIELDEPLGDRVVLAAN